MRSSWKARYGISPWFSTIHFTYSANDATRVFNVFVDLDLSESDTIRNCKPFCPCFRSLRDHNYQFNPAQKDSTTLFVIRSLTTQVAWLSNHFFLRAYTDCKGSMWQSQLRQTPWNFQWIQPWQIFNSKNVTHQRRRFPRSLQWSIMRSHGCGMAQCYFNIWWRRGFINIAISKKNTQTPLHLKSTCGKNFMPFPPHPTLILSKVVRRCSLHERVNKEPCASTKTSLVLQMMRNLKTHVVLNYEAGSLMPYRNDVWTLCTSGDSNCWWCHQGGLSTSGHSLDSFLLNWAPSKFGWGVWNTLLTNISRIRFQILYVTGCP